MKNWHLGGTAWTKPLLSLSFPYDICLCTMWLTEYCWNTLTLVVGFIHISTAYKNMTLLLPPTWKRVESLLHALSDFKILAADDFSVWFLPHSFYKMKKIIQMTNIYLIANYQRNILQYIVNRLFHSCWHNLHNWLKYNNMDTYNC